MEVSGPEDDPFLAQLHRVQCPVCQQAMPAAHINSHLDRCLLLHPAGHAEPAPPRVKRRRPAESSALRQPATPTAAESSEGEAEEPDDGGESESRESYDAPPTPSGARLIPDFPVARPGSPGGKGAAQRPAAAAAAGSASPRSWDEAEAPEEEEAAGDGDADGDGEDEAGRWGADAAAAAFGAPGGRPHARAPAADEVRRLLEGKPLADAMRPDALQDFVGQGRAVGPETLLRSLLEANEVPSLILWGPPGCGKTTLAHIIATNSKKHSIRFVTLSATSAKTNDVRDVIKQAQNEKSFFKRKTVLFIDEIHRFNKSQQDTFLPHVECGTITLIGATTENPSFQVNAALLSRCRVIVLEKLPAEAVVTILMRAINSLGIHVLDSSRPADALSHGSNSSAESGRPVCADPGGGGLPRLPLHRHARVRGAPGPVRRLLGPRPEVHRGLQRLQQRQGLPAEPPGAPAAGPPASAQRAHQAHEGSGLRPGLQVQPRVQRARGPGLPARAAEGRGFLQAAAVLTLAGAGRTVPLRGGPGWRVGGLARVLAG
ncbi:ATPase WRNIP1 isoform X5 [Hippopotamus amphibius kiboko]|uniref:ATPase WRNIP1 isoform X5 n=1 Tax=Hippopotamus amphibius kiboko TaxID=575201 RepID=UPI00259A90A9|nr:ATPase WRNIP1 isoform X5 [Hippopotamus amphibius kiboko]